jgi:hypothetical protein
LGKGAGLKLHRTVLPAALVALVVILPTLPGTATSAAEVETWIAGAAAVPVTPPTCLEPDHVFTDLPAAQQPDQTCESEHRVGTEPVAPSPVPVCPKQLWSGPSPWDFDEPYVDTNGNERYDTQEPYCDANGNGRYDGIWVGGAPLANTKMRRLNDDIFVRTQTISDGDKTVAIASVDALGLFKPDVDLARSKTLSLIGETAEKFDLFVLANHNESSPDAIGLWGPRPGGAPGPFEDPEVPAGTTSGVDDYYIDFLAQRIADSVALSLGKEPSDLTTLTERGVSRAAAEPVTLNMIETRARDLAPVLSQWPTTNRKDSSTATPPPGAGLIEAWDPKVQILSAKALDDGATVFTSVGYDAHIQNIGHSDDPFWNQAITADWPYFFWRDIEAAQGGVSLFLPGTNGSVETPCPTDCAEENTMLRSKQIGESFAATINEALATGPGSLIAPEPIQFERREPIVAVQNQLFVAAFAANLFPHKNSDIAPPSGEQPDEPNKPHIKTSVGVIKVGSIEWMANPGEALPLLSKGSHWGQNEACSTRPNPVVPSWHSSATYRWDLGLANDMIGYEYPAWSWDAGPETYSNPSDPCSTNATNEGGHSHKLESESLGPYSGNIVAQNLVGIIQGFDGTDANDIYVGRYLFEDGTLRRRPYKAAPPSAPNRDGNLDILERAVGIFYAVGTERRVATLDSYDGPFRSSSQGSFVDFDGHVQGRASDITRGMRVGSRTIFVDVWPNSLEGSTPPTQPSPSPSPSSASPSPDPSASPSAEPSASPSGSPGDEGTLTTSIDSVTGLTRYREGFILGGWVDGPDSCPGPYQVTVYKKVAGRPEKEIASVLTRSDGAWNLGRRSRVSAKYRAQVAPSAGCSGSGSRAIEVRVRAKIKLFRTECGPRGGVKGRVRPNKTGSRVTIEQRRNGHWKIVKRPRVKQRSRFRTELRRCARYRVTWKPNGDPLNARGRAFFRTR